MIPPASATPSADAIAAATAAGLLPATTSPAATAAGSVTPGERARALVLRRAGRRNGAGGVRSWLRRQRARGSPASLPRGPALSAPSRKPATLNPPLPPPPFQPRAAGVVLPQFLPNAGIQLLTFASGVLGRGGKSTDVFKKDGKFNWVRGYVMGGGGEGPAAARGWPQAPAAVREVSALPRPLRLPATPHTRTSACFGPGPGPGCADIGRSQYRAQQRLRGGWP